MNKIYRQNFTTPYGELISGSFNNQLCMLDWKNRVKRAQIDTRISKALKGEFIDQSSDTIERTKVQLEEYFNKERKEFDISLLMLGTAFQQSVWNALLEVPYGTTTSYLELSKSINNEKAVRAVANANGANAMSIIIPCHRIIGSNNSLTGYAGGLESKQKLLELEGFIK